MVWLTHVLTEISAHRATCARPLLPELLAKRHLAGQSLGISLRSATEPIDDTSTGKLMEGVLAARSRTTRPPAHEGTTAETARRGVSHRRGKPLTHERSHVAGQPALASIVDVPEYSVRGKRGDFELDSEDVTQAGSKNSTRNRARLQLLAGNRDREGRFGGPEPLIAGSARRWRLVARRALAA